MSELQLTPIDMPNFSAAASRDGERITLTIAGTADLNVREPLKELLGKLHEENLRLAAGRAGEVVVDMRGLRFMNSSCFKGFVSWLNSIRKMPQESQYPVRFCADSAQQWQQRSLDALKTFAGNIVTVENS